jgi:uncharacterized protein (TIGR00255 family)
MEVLMVRSMTGYGRVQQTVDGFNILFEIKSVNHRFFEFSARIPRVYGYIEDKLKTYLQKYISRGKVEIFMTIEAAGGLDEQITLNYGLAESYIHALRELQEKYGLVNNISVSEVAKYSDIFTVVKSPDDEERIWNAVKNVAEEAVAGFVAMREAEGGRLANDITERAKLIAEFVDKVESRSPVTVDEYRQKLKTHMSEVLAEAAVDENRILLEAAIYADKVSVTEETVRLKSHLKQFEVILCGNEPVGRKLDFLMQEMNREANTIGSKASDFEIAGMVVEIKAELEKIREQIQNLE